VIAQLSTGNYAQLLVWYVMFYEYYIN